MDFLSRLVGSARVPVTSTKDPQRPQPHSSSKGAVYDVAESTKNNNNNNNNDNGLHTLIAMSATSTVVSGGSSRSFSSSSIVPVALSANKPEITSPPNYIGSTDGFLSHISAPQHRSRTTSPAATAKSTTKTIPGTCMRSTSSAVITSHHGVPKTYSRSESQHNRGLGTNAAAKSSSFAAAPQNYTSPESNIEPWQMTNENYSSHPCCFSSGGGGAQMGVASGLRTPSLSLSISPSLSFSPSATLKHRLKPQSTSPQAHAIAIAAAACEHQQQLLRQQSTNSSGITHPHPPSHYHAAATTTMQHHTSNSIGGQNITLLPPSLGFLSSMQHAVDETFSHSASSFISNKPQAHREPNLDGHCVVSSKLNTTIGDNGNQKGNKSDEQQQQPCQNNLVLALGCESFAASCSFENPSISNQCLHEFEGSAPPQGVTTMSSHRGRGGLSDAAASASVSPSSFFLFETHPAPPHYSCQQDIFNTAGLRNDHPYVHRHHHYQQQKQQQQRQQDQQRQKSIQYVFDGPHADDREATFPQLYHKRCSGGGAGLDDERRAMDSSTPATSSVASAQTLAGLVVPNSFTALVTPTLTPTATAKRRTRSRAAITSDPSTTTPLLGTSPSTTLHHSSILAHNQPLMINNNTNMNNNTVSTMSPLPVFLPKNSFASIAITDDENKNQQVNSCHSNTNDDNDDSNPTTRCCCCCSEGVCFCCFRPQHQQQRTRPPRCWWYPRCASLPLINKSHLAAPKIRLFLSKFKHHAMLALRSTLTCISPSSSASTSSMAAAVATASSASFVRGDKCSSQKLPQHHTLRRRRFAFISVLFIAVLICTVFIAGETLRFSTSSIRNGSEGEGAQHYAFITSRESEDESIFGLAYGGVSVGKRSGGITQGGGLRQFEKLMSSVRNAQNNKNNDNNQKNSSAAMTPLLQRSVLPFRPSSNHRLIRVPGLTDPTIVAAFMYDEMMRIHSLEKGDGSASVGERKNKNNENGFGSINKNEMNNNNAADDNKKRAGHYSSPSLPTFPLGSIEAYVEHSDDEVDQNEENHNNNKNNNNKCGFSSSSSSTPLVIDLVYTYVNPSSPSFARDMGERQARKGIPQSEWEIVKKKREEEEERKLRENVFIGAFSGSSPLGNAANKGNGQKEGDEESRGLFMVELKSFLALADHLLVSSSTNLINNNNSASRNFLLGRVRELARRKIPNVFGDSSSSRKATSMSSENFGSVAVGDKNEAIRSQKESFSEVRRLKTLYRQYLSLFNDAKEKPLDASAQNQLGRKGLLSVAHEVENALTELSKRDEVENGKKETIKRKHQSGGAIEMLKARVDAALRRLELAENMSESLLAKLGLLRQVGKDSQKNHVAEEGLSTNSVDTSNTPRQSKSRKSHSQMMRKSKISSNGGLVDASVADQQRYRDWNEILYSLRGVFHNLMLGGGGKVSKNKGTMGTSEHRKTVRNIYIVVADRDQAPEWLKTGGELPRGKFNTNKEEEGFLSSSSKKLEPLRKQDSKEKHTNNNNSPEDLKDEEEEEDFIKRIIIVEHKDIVPNHLQSAVLPTFNSYIIESLLHRIPGLAPHYIYFNNDMLLARPVSFFDFFQPFVFSTTTTTTTTLTDKVHAADGKTNYQPIVNQSVEVRWLPIVFSNAIEKFSGYARRDPIIRNHMDILRAAFGWGGRRGDLAGRGDNKMNARVPYDFSPPFLAYSHAPHLIERDLMGRLMEGKRYGRPMALSSPVSSDGSNDSKNTSYFFTNAREEAWKSEEFAPIGNSDEDFVAKKVRNMLYDENNRNNGLRNPNENVFPVFLYNHYQMLKRFGGDYVTASKALVDGGRYQAKTLNNAFIHSYTNSESGSHSDGILGMMNRNFFGHQFGSERQRPPQFAPFAYPQQEEKNTDSSTDIFGNVYGSQMRYMTSFTTTFQSRCALDRSSESDNEGTKELHVTLKRESQRETLFSYLLTLANNKIRDEAEAKLKHKRIGNGMGHNRENPSKQPTLGIITGVKSASEVKPATAYDGKTILLVEVLRIVRSMFENFDSGAQYPSQLLGVGKKSSSLQSIAAPPLENLHGGGDALRSSCDSRSVGQISISTQTAGKSTTATADGGENDAASLLFDGVCAPIYLNVRESPLVKETTRSAGGAAAGRKSSYLSKNSANNIHGNNIVAPILPRYLMGAANPSKVANVSSSSSSSSINVGVNGDHPAHFVDFPRINFQASPTRNVRGSYDHWLLPLLDIFSGHHMTLTSAVRYYFGMMTSTTSTATYNDVIGRRGDVLFLTINDDMDRAGPVMGVPPPPYAVEIINNGDYKKMNVVEPENINNPAHDIQSPRRFGSSLNESKANELHEDICQALEDENKNSNSNGNDENNNEKNNWNLRADSNAFGSRRALFAYYPIKPQQRPAEEILDEAALARDNNMPQNELGGAADPKMQRLASVRRVGNRLFFEKEADRDSPKRQNYAFENALKELVAHPQRDERLVVFGNNNNNENEPNRAVFLNRHHDSSVKNDGNDKLKSWDHDPHLYPPRSELPTLKSESTRDDESVKIARFERKALIYATPLRVVDRALVGAMAIIAAGGTLRSDVLHDKFLALALHSSQNSIQERGGGGIREIQLVARKALKDLDARPPNDEATNAIKIRLFCLSEIVANKAIELEAKTRSLMCKARRQNEKDLKSSDLFATQNTETHMVAAENTYNGGGADDEILSPRGASELVRIYSAFAPPYPSPWEDQNLL